MSSKSEIRHRIWSYMEDSDIALPPRPVFNRIPNFKKSDIACDLVVGLREFNNAKVIKVDPDKPQERARFCTLQSRKILLVPTPRLRSGLFNEIKPQNYKTKTLRTCATSKGVRHFSTPLGLDSDLKIDLIVVGSVAVSKQEHRIGKGEGFSDLEYAMMVSSGAVNPLTTLVMTTVHDCQLFDTLPNDMFGEHDLTVDVIATPTQLIRCEPRPKPKGIIWSLLTRERIAQMPILKTFRDKEQQNGKNVQQNLMYILYVLISLSSRGGPFSVQEL